MDQLYIIYVLHLFWDYVNFGVLVRNLDLQIGAPAQDSGYRSAKVRVKIKVENMI